MEVKKMTLGVDVKRCDKCERGDCNSCAIKNNFEHIVSLPQCNDCGRKDCVYRPTPGDDVRLNCPFWLRQESEA